MQKRVQDFFKRNYSKFSNWINFRVLVNTKNILIIGGSSEQGEEIAKRFKNNWRVINLDISDNQFANQNIRLSDINGENVSKTMQTIKDLQIKFDTIISLNNQDVKGSISSIDVFDQSEQIFKNDFSRQILATHIACKFISNNGLLILSGNIGSFQDPKFDEVSQTIARDVQLSQVHMIGLNVVENDDIPVESTIITVLQDGTQNEGLIADQIRRWSDGIQRPHSPSYCKLNYSESHKKVYPEYL